MKKVVKAPAKDIKVIQSVPTKSKIEPNIFRMNSMVSRQNTSYARQHSESLTRKKNQVQKPVVPQRDLSTKNTVKPKVEIVNRRSSTVSSHRASYSSVGSTNKRKQDAIALANASYKRVKTESLNKTVNKGGKTPNQPVEKFKIDLSKSTIVSIPRKGKDYFLFDYKVNFFSSCPKREPTCK